MKDWILERVTLIKLGSTNKGGLFYQGGEKIVGESKTQVVKGENKKRSDI